MKTTKKKMENDLNKNGRRTKINLIGCDTIVNSPSCFLCWPVLHFLIPVYISFHQFLPVSAYFHIFSSFLAGFGPFLLHFTLLYAQWRKTLKIGETK